MIGERESPQTFTTNGVLTSPLNIKVHDQDGNEIEGPWQTVDRVDLDPDGAWSSMSKIGTFVNDFDKQMNNMKNVLGETWIPITPDNVKDIPVGAQIRCDKTLWNSCTVGKIYDVINRDASRRIPLCVKNDRDENRYPYVFPNDGYPASKGNQWSVSSSSLHSPPPVEEKEREKIYVSDEIEKGIYLNVGDFIYFEENNPTGSGLKLDHPYEIRRVNKEPGLEQPYSIDGGILPMTKRRKAYHY